jgi:PKD repeat protein
LTPGSHTVQISRRGYETETRTVSISIGSTTTVNVTLTPIPVNQPPVASYNYSPTSPIVGDPVQFDATGSSDSDGSIVSYSWNFGDGTSATGALTSHTFTSDATYSVQLTVMDNEGATKTKTRSIVISSLEDVGWIAPVAVNNADIWDDEEWAFDGDPETYANHWLRNGPTWTSWLIFDAPGSGILCDGVRINPSSYANMSAAYVYTWQIEIYRDGEWVEVFDGELLPEDEWRTVTFDAGNLTKLRIRGFTNEDRRKVTVKIREIAFHDATVSAP